MKRIYLAGPMTGFPELNFPAFHAEAARLRALGYEVLSPAEVNVPHPGGWALAMRADLVELLKCDTVALLPGWEDSRGAKLERHIGEQLGMWCVLAQAITEQQETTCPNGCGPLHPVPWGHQCARCGWPCVPVKGSAA